MQQSAAHELTESDIDVDFLDSLPDGSLDLDHEQIRRFFIAFGMPEGANALSILSEEERLETWVPLDLFDPTSEAYKSIRKSGLELGDYLVAHREEVRGLLKTPEAIDRLRTALIYLNASARVRMLHFLMDHLILDPAAFIALVRPAPADGRAEVPESVQVEARALATSIAHFRKSAMMRRIFAPKRFQMVLTALSEQGGGEHASFLE